MRRVVAGVMLAMATWSAAGAACDTTEGAPAPHRTRVDTITPGAFLDWTFGESSGLGAGVRGAFLSRGTRLGVGGYASQSWRAMHQIDASTWRFEAGALVSPIGVGDPDPCSGPSALSPSLAVIHAGFAVHGPNERIAPTVSGVVGIYGSLIAMLGVAIHWPFFGEPRRRGPEVVVSLGLDVPFVVHQSFASP